MLGNLLMSAFGECLASAPAIPAGPHPVPFVQWCRGLSLECPAVQADELKINQLKQIVEKIKKNTLRQDDSLLKSILGTDIVPSECECDLFHRANGWRKTFENNMLNLFNDPARDKTQPFSYVNYSAGLGFQDLMVVTQLIEAGYQDITINLVDSYYKDLVAHANLVKCYEGSSHLTYYPRGQSEVTHAFIALANYFSLLKHIKKSQVRINIFESTQDALQHIKPQSCQLIFCSDFGKPEKIDISWTEQKANPFYNVYQSPTFHKPVHASSFEAQDYFKLAQHALSNKGYSALLTTQLKLRELLPGEPVLDKKIVLGKHVALHGQYMYLYYKNNEPGFSLVVDHKHRFLIDSETQEVVVTDCTKPYTSYKKNSESDRYRHAFEFLRPVLAQGQSLQSDDITKLKDLLTK